MFLSNQIFLVYYRLHKAFPDTLKYRIQSSVLQLFFERLSTFCYNLKVLALVASKFKNTNGTDYANSWLRSRYNQ